LKDLALLSNMRDTRDKKLELRFKSSLTLLKKKKLKVAMSKPSLMKAHTNEPRRSKTR